METALKLVTADESVEQTAVQPVKPVFEDSGYDCKRCKRDIRVGQVFNFPVSREEDLAEATICARCRMQLRGLAKEAGEEMPRIFSLEKTTEYLGELRERRQEEASERLH